MKETNLSKKQIKEMRDALFESFYESITEKALRVMLREGWEGWDNIPDNEIIRQYKEINNG